ncbi:MAG: peptidylprolyl isomerase [Tissierellia bacterium]|nr:peptidylprolyl isomerase [Tissierellia bacterium]
MGDQFQLPKEGEEIAVLHTNHGDIKIRLFEELAPKTVKNFKDHIKEGYYDGIIFHRVIKDFMIQGGDPTGTGMGGESIYGEGFENEISELFHARGALSMANTGQPNSNGSQFFIVQNSKVDDTVLTQMDDLAKDGKYPEVNAKAYRELGGTFHLDGKHTVFGQVFSGMNVVDEIANVETGEMDKPVKDVIIEKAEIVVYK